MNKLQLNIYNTNRSTAGDRKAFRRFEYRYSPLIASVGLIPSQVNFTHSVV